MFEVGRICVKLAGRDAGKKCVIVEVLDDSHVVVDGETRRRKVNIKHIDPTKETLDLKGTDHAAIVDAFNQLGLKAMDTKPKKSKPKAKQVRAADRKKLAAESKPAPKKAAAKPAPKKADTSDKPEAAKPSKPSVEEKLATPAEKKE